MTKRIERTVVRCAGIDPTGIQQLALRGDTLAVLDQANQVSVMSNIDQKESTLTYTRQLSWLPGRLQFSSSARYLSVSARWDRAIKLWDIATDRLLLEQSTLNPRPLTTALAAWNAEDVLLLSKDRCLLEGYHLATQQRLFSTGSEASGMVFQTLVPLADQNTIAVLWYEPSGLDFLLTVSLRDLIAGDSQATPEARRWMGINDYSIRLAAGSCGKDEIVIYRDPEDDEVPDPDENPAELGEVRNFHGLYIRRLADGALVERIPYEGPLQTGAPLFATATTVVVGCPDRIDLVPRQGVGGGIVSIPTRVYAFDPAPARIALITPAGELELLQLTDAQTDSDGGGKP